MKTTTVIVWAAQIVTAVILLQTLFFKFAAAPEPVYIFTTLGVEPWGRIAAGVAELIAGLLLLIPATAVYGALMTVGIGAGAILSHLFILGIAIRVNGESDGGLLFILALIITVLSGVILYLRRSAIPVVGAYLAAQG